ncbi:kinesin-like protein KIFC3 [Pelobates fuscus]|uniref:kinesin-like protein KIFC3 n=1 Tax=Pelobates fuscus TaxID=191477 RepID=UPI002FE4A89F
MSLKRFFKKKELENPTPKTEYMDHKYSRFRPKSTFFPNDKGHQLEAFNRMVLKDLKGLDYKLKDFNLTKKENAILKSIKNRKDIIIKSADKGGGIVVMPIDFYLKESDRILNDTSTYQKLNYNPNSRFNKELEDLLTLGKEKEIIDSKIFSYLFLKAPRIPTFYFLPKVHKSATHPPGRPIISGINSVTSKLSEFIDFHLQKYAQAAKSYLKDTKSLIQELESVEWKDGYMWATVDVTSLYTIIEHELGLQAVKKVVEADSELPADLGLFLLESNQFAFSFNTQFNTHAKKIKNILKKHWPLLLEDEFLKTELPRAPQVIFKKGKNLKNILAPSTFKNQDKPVQQNEGFFTCVSPLLAVTSHLVTFLEHYSQMQSLQEKAQEYRAQLRREERRRRKQLRILREAYRQRMRDKMNLVESLEDVICEQQAVLHKLQRGAISPVYPSSPLSHVGVHKLVESISLLQAERVQLKEEIAGLRQDMDMKEQEKQCLTSALRDQVDELKEIIREREADLSQRQLEMGATDSEKRLQCLTLENQSLKQSLSVTQGLLEKLAAVSTQPSTQLVKENEDLRNKVLHLEASLQEKVEQLVHSKGQVETLQWRKEDEIQQLDEKIHRLQLSLENERKRPPDVQYITKTLEVESPTVLRSLAEAEIRNHLLLDQVSIQGEKCHRLEGQLRGSEELTSSLRVKIQAYETEIGNLKTELMQEIHQLEAQKEDAIREASECSDQHLKEVRGQLLGVQTRLTLLQPFLKNMKMDYNSLRSQVKNFSQFYELSISEARKQICHAVTNVSENNRDLLAKYQREVQLRKRYHNQLVELKGNIRVLCRVRPPAEGNDQEPDSPLTTDRNDDTRLSVLYKGKERTFELDKVFLPQSTQEEVFLEIEPVVMSCLNGYNVCIFAYGQTGSGKTFTMEGTSESPGINKQALQALYKEMEDRRGLWEYSVDLNMVEIYNEVIRDLLSKDPQDKLDVKMNPDGSGQLHVPGLTSMEVRSFGHIKKLLSLGKRNRATFCTNMNERSSRSHALLTVTVSGRDLTTGTVTTGKLNLVDLAGSERVWKSGAEGERLKEAQNINKSLLALGEVIQALRSKQGHIPFRNSKLTYLLQDSLGKGNKTIMMVQVSPLESNVGETVCSLNFAQRVCKVELGPASRKVDSG